MSGKASFKNPFEDFSPNKVYSVLNETNDAISEELNAKLQSFKNEKLSYYVSQSKRNIFQDDATVYTGSGGLALFYLMSSLGIEENDKVLQKALEYVEVKKLKGKRISFLCGDAGPLAMATVISYKLGSKRPDSLPSFEKLAQRLINLISLLNDSPDELLYGKVGYLYAVLFVNKYVDGKEDIIHADHITQIIVSILKSGKQFAQQQKSKSPLLWQWHEKIYLGAAHGVAGILLMLLQARAYIEEDELRDLIKPTVDWLLNLQFPSGNFPSSLGSSSGDRLVQWCHGAPGFVPLCLIAYQVFKEEKYLKTAVRCGDVIWERGLCTKGYSLCHGVSGNAYAFLQLYQATKDPQHLYRACCFLEWCISERPGTELHSPDRPASLFEGVLGRIFLAEHIINPLQSTFPALCL